MDCAGPTRRDIRVQVDVVAGEQRDVTNTCLNVSVDHDIRSARDRLEQNITRTVCRNRDPIHAARAVV